VIRTLAQRAFADGRVRTYSFAACFALLAYIQPAGYRHSFPTLRDRLSFAHSFGDNKAIRLFYGKPYDLLTTGGYSAWRVGGILAIAAAAWGMLAAVRALRAEEEAGRSEVVLAAAVTRRTAYVAALLAIGTGAALLWIGTFAGLAGGRLPAGGAAYLALACVTPAAVFAGIGALAAQLAPTRRIALELAGGALVAALLLRVVADTSASLSWLRWATPLGWAEELRPFSGARPAVLVLPLLASAALGAAAGRIAERRDVGRGLLGARDSAPPRLRFLSSSTALALRLERGSLIAWTSGIAAFALIVGLLVHTFASAHLSAELKRQLAKLGAGSIVTPKGALGFYFLFFALAISLFLCSQVAGARREEADGRLETSFALPVARHAWLGGRLALAACTAALLALAAGLFAWLGATTQGGGVSLADMAAGGANCLPPGLCFLGLGALALAALPRATTGVSYGLVAISFVWELVGALLGAPGWTLALSPFHELALVPAESFDAGGAAALLGVAAVAGAAAFVLFERRDLSGA
jgi:ABC-2 type transport system permease protein